MLKENYPPLACPEHSLLLELHKESLHCSVGHEYPVIHGIPRFVANEEYAASFGYQWNRFRTTQLDQGPGESTTTLLTKTGFSPQEVAGKTVLEGGCGMGRFLAIVSAWGAMATGVDLSLAVEAAKHNLRERARIVQADLNHLPFLAGSFDIVFSIGVLHHTPDPQAAFQALARLVRPGGDLCVWVYSAEKRDKLAAGLKYTYRRFTPRMDPARLERMARLAIPLYRIHRLPVVGFLTRKLLPTSMHPIPEWRVLDTLDDYSAFYRWRHTYDEVENWFREAGYVDLRRFPTPVAVRGRRQQ